MKLALFLFIIFMVFVSVLNCSEEKPTREWKDVASFLNPFATFQPSIISKGHIKSFEPIDNLNDEQRKNLKEFINTLEIARTVALGANACCVFLVYRYGLFSPSRPISSFVGIGLILSSCSQVVNT